MSSAKEGNTEWQNSQ